MQQTCDFKNRKIVPHRNEVLNTWFDVAMK